MTDGDKKDIFNMCIKNSHINNEDFLYPIQAWKDRLIFL